MNSQTYVKAIGNFLDEMSSSHGDVGADIQIVQKLVDGWQSGTKQDKLSMKIALLRMCQELAEEPEGVKFGTEITLIISPELVLTFDDALSEWLETLSEMESVDVNRVTMGMAQFLAGRVVELSKIQLQRRLTEVSPTTPAYNTNDD
jgi:hypothetical protein